MELLRLEDVHLTYPPKFKRQGGGSGDADAGDVDAELTGGEEEAEETAPEGGRTGPDVATVALRGVSFTVAEGESLALLGRAGSGRTTVLSVISGVLRPDSGRVLIRGFATGVPAAGAGFAGEATVGKNIVRNAILMGTSKARARELVPLVSELAGFADRLDEPLRELTRQETRRLGYAVALHAEPTVFIADEDLVMGPADLKEAALARMERFPGPGRALVVATNRPELVRRLCTRALVLQDGLVEFDGTVDEGLKAMRRRKDQGGGPDRPHDRPGGEPDERRED